MKKLPPFKPTFRMIFYASLVPVVIIPLLINVWIWKALDKPQNTKLKNLRQIERMHELEPALSRLLVTGRELISDWQQKSFVKQDPAAAMQLLEKLATKNGIQVKQIFSKGPQIPDPQAAATAVSGYNKMPVDLQLTGSFSHIAKWITDVENQGAIHIDTWNMAAQDSIDQSVQLSMNATVFLRES